MACREPRLWYTVDHIYSLCDLLWLAENRGFGTLRFSLSDHPTRYGLPRTAALVH